MMHLVDLQVQTNSADEQQSCGGHLPPSRGVCKPGKSEFLLGSPRNQVLPMTQLQSVTGLW